MTTNNTNNYSNPLGIANGGTGGSTKTVAFNNLSPTTTSGDLISFDSTNNIRVAEGSVGQTLIADSAQTSGLNWTNGGPIFRSTTVLTSSQIKNLHATPITIVPAPAAGVWNNIQYFLYKYTYGGNNAFTNLGGQLEVDCQNSSGSIALSGISVVGLLDQTANMYFGGVHNQLNMTSSQAEGNVLVIRNTGTEYTGNAANDNTLTVVIYYGQVSL